MITSADQIAVIDMIAANTGGLIATIYWAMGLFIAFLVLVIVSERINSNLQSKRFAAFVNNASNGNTVQEDTMANNANNQEVNNTPATEVIVTEELTIRDRITNWFAARRVTKIEKVEAKAEAKRKKLEDQKVEQLRALNTQIQEINAKIESVKVKTDKDLGKNIEDLAEALDRIQKPTLAEKFSNWVFSKLDERKARKQAKADAKAAAKVAAEAERIRKLREECGYFLLEQQLKDLKKEVQNMEVEVVVKAPEFAPVAEVADVPEAESLMLKRKVEKLLKEANDLLDKDRRGALELLRNSDVARKYQVPTNLNFISTLKVLLRLIA